MATQNLSAYDMHSVPSARGMRFGIVAAEWNAEVTNALAKGALDTLLRHGAQESDVILKHVPGT
ncbi:MAG: 6,7-dimethyl-8-ribityllumazine synthase, partial [Mangrovibacterium sp.]